MLLLSSPSSAGLGLKIQVSNLIEWFFNMSEPQKKKGRPSKYNPTLPQKLYDTLARGEYVCTFCSNTGISEETFYKWIKDPTKKDLVESYKRGQAAGKAWFLASVRNAAFGLTELRVNNGLIALLAVNCYGMTTGKEVIKTETEEAKPSTVEVTIKDARKQK
jgi:hypothetical protein